MQSEKQKRCVIKPVTTSFAFMHVHGVGVGNVVRSKKEVVID